MEKKVICYDRNEKTHKINFKDLFFRPSVYGILIQDNKILLSKQWDGYDFPGGGMNIDENVDEALEREFWEETGINVKRGNVVACESCFFTNAFTKKSANFILIYYLVNMIGGSLNIDNIDEEESRYIDMPEWIDLDKINKIKFHNSVDSPKLIKEAIEVNKNFKNIHFNRRMK